MLNFRSKSLDFVEEVEKRLTKAWEFRYTSSQKDAGCGLALITRWTGPTQVALACLPKNRHLSRWNVCAPVVFFHLSKIRALHEEPIFVHSAMHLNGSEMVKGGLLRRIWRTYYDKRWFWHGRRNLRKDIGIYGLDILWILPVVFPGKSGDLSQSHRRCSTLKRKNYYSFPNNSLA